MVFSLIISNFIQGDVNMIINEIKNNAINFSSIDKENVLVGNQYLLHDVVYRAEFKGDYNTYFMERVLDNEGFFMTDNTGVKPFAVATNDCERDKFKYRHLSNILVQDGYFAVYAYRDKKISGMLHFIIFEVLTTRVDNDLQDCLEVRAVHRCDSLFNIPTKFQDVIDHANAVVGLQVSDQLIDKYCYNPTRYITVRLFQSNSRDDLESYLPDGKKLIFNNNSLEKRKFGKVVEGGLYRIFYSRKFRQSRTIFVDGKGLEPLKEDEVVEYIQHSQLDTLIANSLIQEIELENGYKFFAITNINGDIRPIYKSANGFSSFALNEHEKTFIKNISNP
jgi:hypothetical protein